MDSARPDPADAAIALAAVALSAARLPLRMATRLPGMGRIATDGAAVRARALSRIEGMVEDAVDRVLAGPLPDAVIRLALEHQVAERIAAELAAGVDLDAALATALDHEMTQRLVDAVIASPGFDRVVEHVSASPEVRAALTMRSSTLAEETAEGVRSRAETLDDTAERAVHGWLRRPRPA